MGVAAFLMMGLVLVGFVMISDSDDTSDTSVETDADVDTGNNTVVGGDGDDILSGGAGADVFVYDFGGGADLILDFETAGTDQDTLALVGFGSIAYADLVFTIDAASNAVLDFGSGQTVTFDGVALADLSEDHFTFHDTAFV